jgi:hypothetical protein
MSATRTCSLVFVVGSLVACQSPRPPEILGIATSGVEETGDTSTGVSSSEEDTGILLDVADADLPSEECASIERSTTRQELPSDVIIVADPEADLQLLRDSVSNLSPELESDGITDARIILVAGPAPDPEDVPPQNPGGDCETWPWPCWDPQTVPPDRFFTFLERDIDPDTLLTDLLALSDDWGPLLREESWKHVWVYASRSADTTTSGPEFAAAFSGLGPSYANFAFHVALSGGFVDDDYVQLARDTGGVHFPRDVHNTGEVYVDFVVAIEELLATNPLSCVYAIPEPPNGQSFDRTRVNVQYDIGLGPETLGYVESVDDCAEFGNGWYYDDLAAPREILFCPQTCGLFKAQELASIRIQFGCATIPAG